MPDKEQELRIVARKGAEGEMPPGLRILKTIKTPRNDTYLVVAPGLAPSGLHLSLHPSGEIHLKSKDKGVIAKVELKDIVGSFQSGAMDEVLSALLSSPAPGQRATGAVVRPERLPMLDPSSGRAIQAISVEDLAEMATPIEIDDTSHLAGHIDWLRQHGHLPVKGILTLELEASRDVVVFVNAYANRPHIAEKIVLPRGVPMARTVHAVVDQLQIYGGFFVSIPNENSLAALAEKVGIGDFYRAFKGAIESIGEVDAEGLMADFRRDLELIAANTLSELVAQRVLKPPTESKSRDIE